MKIRANVVLIWLILFLAALQFSGTVSAETVDLEMEIDSLGCTSLADAELARQSGGQNIELLQVYDTEQNALLQDNWLQGGINGANSIDGGSFSGAMGFTSVIQNSGNNVIIQDSTLVNIMFNQ